MDTILQAIGNTPLVEIKKLNPNPNVRIFAKLEGFNPGGSMKDRVALAMIENAERAGVLVPGKTVVEVTNGNTGVGIAMVAAAKGYKAIIVSPETVSEDRQKVIRGFGAKVITVKPEMWRQGAINLVNAMVAKDESLVVLDQFANKAACNTHYLTTGKEIVSQLAGSVDYFISCVGTGGAISGVARQLRENYPQVRVIGIQPRIWGTGASIEIGASSSVLSHNLPCADHSKALVDTIVEIGEDEAKAMGERITNEEGIFAGPSAGAALMVARLYAEKMKSGTIVTIFPDRGERYQSTEIFRS
ncbi:MAG: cysteine synthase family protein [Candidatus Pacebacteria bacterium]|nr:cysteine synthase family protein [Candidatus Paceibacterota bacterium]